MSSINGGQAAAGALPGRSRGIATPTAPGGTAAFNVAHGLAGTPAFVSVIPRNALSAALMFVTADATNITVTYAVAPLAGALGFYWTAEL